MSQLRSSPALSSSEFFSSSVESISGMLEKNMRGKIRSKLHFLGMDYNCIARKLSCRSGYHFRRASVHREGEGGCSPLELSPMMVKYELMISIFFYIKFQPFKSSKSSKVLLPRKYYWLDIVKEDLLVSILPKIKDFSPTKWITIWNINVY